MGILITGILGIVISLICLFSACSNKIQSIENPDWMDKVEIFIKQLILVAITYLAEMFMFVLLVDNSEIIKSTHSTPEFIRSIATSTAYMGVMYVIGKVYAITSGLSKD